jgi:hypothetical protein
MFDLDVVDDAPPIQDEARERLRRAFSGIDGTKALVIIGDSDTKRMRGQFVINENGWEFAIGGGFDFTGHVPFAEFTVMKVWK